MKANCYHYRFQSEDSYKTLVVSGDFPMTAEKICELIARREGVSPRLRLILRNASTRSICLGVIPPNSSLVVIRVPNAW